MLTVETSTCTTNIAAHVVVQCSTNRNICVHSVKYSCSCPICCWSWLGRFRSIPKYAQTCMLIHTVGWYKYLILFQICFPKSQIYVYMYIYIYLYLYIYICIVILLNTYQICFPNMLTKQKNCNWLVLILTTLKNMKVNGKDYIP